MEYKINLAIISDLHCHSSSVKYDSQTYLQSDLLRNTIQKHPVESLNKLIASESITADLVLCPGDFCNRADVQGFITGWDSVIEISKNLKSDEIVATIGNHDIPSRDTSILDIFSLPKGIGKDFPLKDQNLADEFWDKGFCLYEHSFFQILVINSVKFHSNQSEIDKGRLSPEQLSNIEAKISANPSDKIKIALCHHHPIAHERLSLGSHDLMILGSELVDILNKNKFDILIHGHKHDPWLRYSTGSNSLPVFSSGSFSATDHILFSDRKNTFHIIQIVKKTGFRAQGTIATYEFYPGKGWEKSSGKQSLPYLTGFGSGLRPVEICKTIITHISSEKVTKWFDILSVVPEVLFLTEQEQLELEAELLSNEIQIVPSFPSSPEYLIKI